MSVLTATGIERDGRAVIYLAQGETDACLHPHAFPLRLDAADCAHLRDLFGEMHTRLRKTGAADAGDTLTDREFEVLGLLAAGLSNKEAARRLGISARTVETHRLNLRRKTKTGRLHEIVTLARDLGARCA